MAYIIDIFLVLDGNKISSRMAQISEHINYSNHKIHSYDQMSKMVVNLGSKKCKNNNISAFQLNHPQDLLLMSIFDIPEKSVSNVDRKLDKRKVRASSIKLS